LQSCSGELFTDMINLFFFASCALATDPLSLLDYDTPDPNCSNVNASDDRTSNPTFNCHPDPAKRDPVCWWRSRGILGFAGRCQQPQAVAA